MTHDDRLFDRRARLAAAGIVAVVSTTVAASAHALAGGGTPSLVAILGALTASTAVGMLVIGPRLTHTRIVAGVIVDQLLFHALFAFFGTQAAATSSGSVHGDHANGHGMLDLAVGLSVPVSATAMLMSHLGAAVVAYGMLRFGTVAIAGAVRAVALLVRAAWVVPSISGPRIIPRRLRAHGQRVLPRSFTLILLPDRRGPPLVAAV